MKIEDYIQDEINYVNEIEMYSLDQYLEIFNTIVDNHLKMIENMEEYGSSDEEFINSLNNQIQAIESRMGEFTEEDVEAVNKAKRHFYIENRILNIIRNRS